MNASEFGRQLGMLARGKPYSRQYIWELIRDGRLSAKKGDKDEWIIDEKAIEYYFGLYNAKTQSVSTED